MPRTEMRKWKPSAKQATLKGEKLKKDKNTNMQPCKKRYEEPEAIRVPEMSDSDNHGKEAAMGEDDSDGMADDIHDDVPLSDGLRDHHIASLPTLAKTKADSTRDLLLVFSDSKKVIFKTSRGLREALKGRWCNLCRKDAGGNKKLLQKSFFTGSNTSCRQHIRQHYEFYSQQCKEKGIEESERCVPSKTLQKQKTVAKRQGTEMVQTKVDGMFADASKAPIVFD
ncbi:hypothetical protein EDB89DRAFT_1900232 [Lactarius sanguifluus]|nr:hypothetical protein EDB89DRAFT_1900232 [Lactarius sanguifluus]